MALSLKQTALCNFVLKGVFLKRHETEIIPWDFESGHSARFRVSSNNGAPILEHLMLPC